MFTRTIIDVYHGDTVDIPLLTNNGVQGVMMKATQGVNYIDPTFKDRMATARANGLLVGSYHFGTGEDPIVQAHHWLETAKPQAGDVLEFDWEDNPNGASMTYEQACAFVREVFQKIGRFPLLYGSNYLSEKIPSSGDSILFSCPLSLASYTAKPKIPRGWKNYTLWQFTGDGQGPFSPHTFPGAANPLDVCQFDGTIAELRAGWPFAAIASTPIPVPPPVPAPVPTPKFVRRFGIFSQSNKINFADVKRIAEACHRQMTEDFFKVWGRAATVEGFASETEVPVGYIKVIIKDDIGEPGAFGFHTDENNQPIAFVKAQDIEGTCVTCSHEIGETITDPSGDRFIVIDLPPYGRVRCLVETFDPPESFAYGTAATDLPVSDFITPEWYDETPTAGTRYSFKWNIKTPQTLAKGGYFSFMLPNGQWMQQTYFGSQPIFEGPFNWKLQPGERVRQMVDRETNARRIAA